MSKYNDYDDYHYYGNRKMSHKNKKIVGLISLFLVLVVSLIGIYFYLNFTAFATNPETVRTALSSKKNANSDYQIYFYRQGCSDCKSIRWQILKQENLNTNPNIKYLNIDANNPKNEKYVAQYGINKTPVMLHVVNGNVVGKQELVDGELK